MADPGGGGGGGGGARGVGAPPPPLAREFFYFYIIDSVESICRDTTYTQYMPIQKNLSKSQKRYTYKPL